jgi:2-polyprenyl-6-methoxyphenol hydroxylase-like FAD-dependent oxidoreductase
MRTQVAIIGAGPAGCFSPNCCTPQTSPAWSPALFRRELRRAANGMSVFGREPGSLRANDESAAMQRLRAIGLSQKTTDEGAPAPGDEGNAT